MFFGACCFCVFVVFLALVPEFLDPNSNQCPKAQLLEHNFWEPTRSIKPCVLELALVSEPNGKKKHEQGTGSLASTTSIGFYGIKPSPYKKRPEVPGDYIDLYGAKNKPARN